MESALEDDEVRRQYDELRSLGLDEHEDKEMFDAVARGSGGGSMRIGEGESLSREEAEKLKRKKMEADALAAVGGFVFSRPVESAAARNGEENEEDDEESEETTTGRTPLHEAVSMRDKKRALEILESHEGNAAVNAADSEGVTPLMLAAESASQDNTDVNFMLGLLNFGADPNLIDNEGTFFAS